MNPDIVDIICADLQISRAKAWELIYQAVQENPEAIRALLAERDALREALTDLCEEIDKHEIHTAISKTNISWFKRKSRAALTQEKS